MHGKNETGRGQHSESIGPDRVENLREAKEKGSFEGRRKTEGRGNTGRQAIAEVIGPGVAVPQDVAKLGPDVENFAGDH